MPADEQRSTRHLFRHRQFGKDIFHCLVLGAANLEAALVKAYLHSKDATTSLQEHFQHEFLNAARELYTQVLLEGGIPKFHLLSRLSAPPHLQVWEPNEHGLPRRCYCPWTRQGSPAAAPTRLSIYRRKIQFLEWRLAQNIPVTPPSSHVWGKLFWVTVGIFRMIL